MAAFAKGDRFDRPAMELTAAWVDAYVAAVEDDAIQRYPGVVPPMGIAALTVRSLLEEAPLPDGAVHAAQEIAFRALCRVGDAVTVSAVVASRNERAGWVLLVVETRVASASSAEVLVGRSTLTFPAGVGGSLDDLPGPAPIEPRTDAAVFERLLTQEKINAYADASGDHNPLHVDAGFAAGTRFGGTIAHGMLVLSYLSEMMTLECGEEWMHSGHMKVRFRGAARPGDTVSVYRAVRDSASWDIEARNERNEVLVSGQASVR
jgi:acyl dehydratase